jgi:PleD family two-component response regulator
MAKKKILVVDDSEWFQETIKAVLEVAGFDVVTAMNGKEGLERVYRDTPDLVLLDCIMPELDGYGVVKAMREDPVLFHTPIIMLTGKDNEYDEIQSLQLGIDDYMSKPFTPPVLIARITTVLEKKESNVSANPLTMLSGNTVIKAEAEKRISSGIPFAMVYIDLGNFKSFNDKYGFQRGDDVIKKTAAVLIRAVRECGQKGDFIGHIGGDDFIILAASRNYVQICERVIALFDEGIPAFYDPVDRQQGFIISLDRNNNVQKFPLMTISLAVINTGHTKIVHYGQMSAIAAELKKLAKKYNHSAYVVDRRKA